jgi:hypothetical protein
MKKIFLLLFLFVTSYAKAQDSLKLKQIDSLVNVINHSSTKPQFDSVLQNYPDLILKMRTDLTMIKDGTQLKKYEQKVVSESKENGVLIQMNSNNAFYFDDNKLIKMEEMAKQGDKAVHFHWYFENGKSIYNTMQSGKAAERAAFLLTLADSFLKVINK